MQLQVISIRSWDHNILNLFPLDGAICPNPIPESVGCDTILNHGDHFQDSNQLIDLVLCRFAFTHLDSPS